MKLYTFRAPNPFRVQVFLAEKGIELPQVTVNLPAGESRTADFAKVNSLHEVPVLELDDGTRITESVAICRYLESLYPEPALMGRTALEAARTEMWNRRMEFQIFGPIVQFALHSFDFFAGKVHQFPDYGASQKDLQVQKWAWLDRELSDGRTWVVDDRFSIADITGMAGVLVCGFAGLEIPADLVHARRWEAAVRARPSFDF
ncbi:MAG: glutathione S-transferase family protein [Pseudomonadota bacterium]|nr:glutathione S-transferase family protein [Pseudomonadota bacterium]